MFFMCAMAYFFAAPITDYFKSLKDDPVKNGINKSSVVNSTLVEMLNEFQANRAYVYRFHNGQNYYDGSHKIKTSMDYEVLSKGVGSVGLVMQDVPTSLFATQIQDVIENKVINVKVNDLRDLAAASLLRDFGVKRTAIVGYYDNNKLLLLVGLDWMSDEPTLFLQERFERYANTIGLILTNQQFEEMFSLNGVSRGENPRPDTTTFEPIKLPNNRLTRLRALLD